MDLAGAAVMVPGLLSANRAEEAKKEASKSPTAGLLPIGQVVLFSSGVGYFKREGTIEGTQKVDLTFAAQDINDLIKSMTLRDIDGGHITAVSYDSNVPVERTLQSFAVNLAANPSFSNILNQARGEKVEVTLQQTNAAQPGTLTGSVVGVEHKKTAVGEDGGGSERLSWAVGVTGSVGMSAGTRGRPLFGCDDSAIAASSEKQFGGENFPIDFRLKRGQNFGKYDTQSVNSYVNSSPTPS